MKNLLVFGVGGAAVRESPILALLLAVGLPPGVTARKRRSFSLFLSALAACALVAAVFWLTPAARADYFDANGEVIGGVAGDAYVGRLNPAPITVFANGGTGVFGALTVWNKATLAMSGGQIGYGLGLFDDSVVNLGAGTIGGEIALYDRSVLNITGGTAGDGIVLHNDSVANVHGGNVSASYDARDFSIMTFYGTNLSAEPQGGGLYYLGGRLTDGTDLIGSALTVEPGASFKLVEVSGVAAPEPSALGLIAAGSLLLPLFNERKKR